jgi:hypothetical protein
MCKYVCVCVCACVCVCVNGSFFFLQEFRRKGLGFKAKVSELRLQGIGLMV